MKIEKFVTGIISTNCYLVSNEETRQAVIVDPAAVPRALKETVEREGPADRGSASDPRAF